MQSKEIFTEIEHGFDAYSDEELLEQSQFNAQALLMASVHAFAGDQDAAGRWAEGVARTFASSWDASRSWAPMEILDALLTNYRSFGAEVIEADLSPETATALIAGIPDLELAESLGCGDAEADVLFIIGEHLVATLGHQLSWSRDPETGDVRLVVA